MSSFFPLLLVLSSVSAPDAGTIIERSVQANAADFKAQEEYCYTQTEKSDSGPAKTYEVLMMLGSPYRRLVAIDGRPLAPGRERRELQKMRDTLERRKRESPEEREARRSKFRKQKQQEDLMLSQMTKAFTFKLIGTEDLRGHQVYVLDAVPDPKYEPINTKAKVLTGMRGKLWIDSKTFHWVRVEAEVVDPVYFEGFLARVDPGTKFVLDKEPVEEGVWMPTRFVMQVNAKILGLFSHNPSQQDTFSNYRRSSEVAQRD